MKKFLFILVAVAFLSPTFADEKKDDHANSDKKTEASEQKGSERSSKGAAGKNDVSKKIDACLKDRPEKAAK